MSFKVDILVIKESKLDSTVHNNDVYLTGFELVREDPNHQEGMEVVLVVVEHDSKLSNT